MMALSPSTLVQWTVPGLPLQGSCEKHARSQAILMTREAAVFTQSDHKNSSSYRPFVMVVQHGPVRAVTSQVVEQTLCIILYLEWDCAALPRRLQVSTSSAIVGRLRWISAESTRFTITHQRNPKGLRVRITSDSRQSCREGDASYTSIT
ncbi:hypothetical protein OH77DRAFT_541293 [Trametes cingulata]|nr:hypothetical protein OH77DRAFT_541293 [Trametes cingulata]